MVLGYEILRNVNMKSPAALNQFESTLTGNDKIYIVL